MKKLSLLLSAVLLLASRSMAEPQWVPIDRAVPEPPTTKVTENSDAGTVLDVTIHGFWRDTCRVGDTLWDAISIPDCAPASLDIGRPEVPCISHVLGVPDNAQVTLSVEELESTLFDSILCYPYQGPRLEDSTYSFKLDSSFYETSVPYPALNGAVTSTGKWRTLSVAGMETYPVNYTPASQQLTVFSHYRVNVTYLGGVYSQIPVQPWVRALFARHLVNFSLLNLPVLETDDAGAECLVLCQQDWAGCPGLLELIRWDSTRGIRTKFDSKPVWTASTVKQAILDEYNSHYPSPTLHWVLLVGPPLGDAPGCEHPIPMHQWGTHDYEVGDYWYSDLKPEGNPDGYPEVGIARLSPQDLNDLNNQCWRILNYEKNPPAGSEAWTTRMLLIAGCIYPDLYNAAINRVHNWNYSYYRYDIDRIYGSAYPSHGNPDLVERFSSAALGPGVVGYRGHGAFSCWYNWATGPDNWGGDEVAACNFGARTPVVCGFTCWNGEANPNNSNLCLSREWMSGGDVVRTTGAVASLAATRPSHQDPNDRMSLMMARSVGDWSSEPYRGAPVFDIGTIGQNLAADLTSHRGGRNPEEYDENREMFYFLGYPTMPVWSGGIPEDPVVICPSLVPDGPYEYRFPVRVQTADGRPVEDALVCAWKKNPPVTGPTEFYATATTNPNGNTSVLINPLTPGEFSVTVSTGHASHGPLSSPHTPIKPSHDLISSAGGHANMVYVSSILDDATYGNGNGAIEPGERIRMRVMVKNEGPVYAPGAFGILHYFDPDPNKHYVHFSNQQVYFGDLPAGASCPPDCAYFDFTVTSDCPMGYSIPFWLEFHDQPGNMCGNSYFNYPVSAGLPPDAGPSATFPTQARHLVRRPNSNELHIVYQKPDPVGIDSIWYQKSSDGGSLWSRDALAQGQNPCISLDFNILPWVTYTRNDSLFGSFMDICGQWHEFLIYYNPENVLGPASFVCSNLRNINDVTQPPDMGYIAFTMHPQGAQFHDCALLLAAFDPAHVDPTYGWHTYGLPAVVHNCDGYPDVADTMPCIAKTPGDILHVVWWVRRTAQNGLDSIMYQTPDNPTTPWSIRTGNFPTFSNAPTKLAFGDGLTSPFVDAYGQEVYAAWTDALPWPDGWADVQRKKKSLTLPWPVSPENWSQSDEHPSDYPVMSGGTLVWANDGCDEEHFDVRARWSLTDPPATVRSGGECPQAFLHTDYQQSGNIARGVLRTLFTEMTLTSRYAVRLAQYVNIPTDPNAPFYSADIGDSAPSPFCVHRDGAMELDGHSIDYADSALAYRLPYLNPLYRYCIRASVYQNTAGPILEEFTLTDTGSTVVAQTPLVIPPNATVEVLLDIPPCLYQDGVADLAITRLQGAFAALAGLAVYEREGDSSGSGGLPTTPRVRVNPNSPISGIAGSNVPVVILHTESVEGPPFSADAIKLRFDYYATPQDTTPVTAYSAWTGYRQDLPWELNSGSGRYRITARYRVTRYGLCDTSQTASDSVQLDLSASLGTARANGGRRFLGCPPQCSVVTTATDGASGSGLSMMRLCDQPLTLLQNSDLNNGLQGWQGNHVFLHSGSDFSFVELDAPADTLDTLAFLSQVIPAERLTSLLPWNTQLRLSADVVTESLFTPCLLEAIYRCLRTDTMIQGPDTWDMPGSQMPIPPGYASWTGAWPVALCFQYNPPAPPCGYAFDGMVVRARFQGPFLGGRVFADNLFMDIIGGCGYEQANWMPFDTLTVIWLNGMPGEKQIHAQLQDFAGNETQELVSDTFVFDPIAPMAWFSFPNWGQVLVADTATAILGVAAEPVCAAAGDSGHFWYYKLTWGRMTTGTGGCDSMYGILPESLFYEPRPMPPPDSLGFVQIPELAEWNTKAITDQYGPGCYLLMLVALDSAGNQAQCEVGVYLDTGMTTMASGGAGSGAMAITTTPGNDLYVGTTTGQITQYTSELDSVQTITVQDSTGPAVITGLATDSTGAIYVGDTRDKSVKVCDEQGSPTDTIGNHTQLTAPNSVVLARNGDVWVADRIRNVVRVYDQNNNLKLSFGSTGNDTGQFLGAYALALGYLDMMYLETSLDSSGNPVADTSITTQIRCLVADKGNHRIQVFDTAGHYLTSFGDSILSQPVALSIDNDNCCYVADQGNRAIFGFNPNGGLYLTIRGASADSIRPIATTTSTDNSSLYALDQHTHDLVKYLVHYMDSTQIGGAQSGGVNPNRIPKELVLEQSRPNPAAGCLTIRYGLPRLTAVSLKVYDISGQLVRTLHNNDRLKPGFYNITWNCRDNRDRQVSNGVYFYRLVTGDKLQTLSSRPAARVKTRKLVIAR